MRALIVFAPVALVVGGFTVAAYISRFRERRRKHLAAALQAAADEAENERRRAIHPSGRDVSKRTVHIAPDWRDMWADFYRTEHVS